MKPRGVEEGDSVLLALVDDQLADAAPEPPKGRTISCPSRRRDQKTPRGGDVVVDLRHERLLACGNARSSRSLSTNVKPHGTARRGRRRSRGGAPRRWGVVPPNVGRRPRFTTAAGLCCRPSRDTSHQAGVDSRRAAASRSPAARGGGGRRRWCGPARPRAPLVPSTKWGRPSSPAAAATAPRARVLTDAGAADRRALVEDGRHLVHPREAAVRTPPVRSPATSPARPRPKWKIGPHHHDRGAHRLSRAPNGGEGVGARAARGLALNGSTARRVHPERGQRLLGFLREGHERGGRALRAQHARGVRVEGERDRQRAQRAPRFLHRPVTSRAWWPRWTPSRFPTATEALAHPQGSPGSIRTTSMRGR